MIFVSRVRTLRGHSNWVKNIEYSHHDNVLVTSGSSKLETFRGLIRLSRFVMPLVYFVVFHCLFCLVLFFASVSFVFRVWLVLPFADCLAFSFFFVCASCRLWVAFCAAGLVFRVVRPFLCSLCFRVLLSHLRLFSLVSRPYLPASLSRSIVKSIKLGHN